uniref:C-type lectin domain-containing protein n=1 Tax=Apteryx owenii TaxID=8824 RepID=A0A8B9NUT0_APTOW
MLLGHLVYSLSCTISSGTLSAQTLAGDFGPISCPDGWVPYVDHCYKIFRETKAWKEALTSCQKEESHLASIHNLEEHSFIVSWLWYSEYFQRAFCLHVHMHEVPVSW